MAELMVGRVVEVPSPSHGRSHGRVEIPSTKEKLSFSSASVEEGAADVRVNSVVVFERAPRATGYGQIRSLRCLRGTDGDPTLALLFKEDARMVAVGIVAMLSKHRNQAYKPLRELLEPVTEARFRDAVGEASARFESPAGDAGRRAIRSFLDDLAQSESKHRQSAEEVSQGIFLSDDDLFQRLANLDARLRQRSAQEQGAATSLAYVRVASQMLERIKGSDLWPVAAYDFLDSPCPPVSEAAQLAVFSQAQDTERLRQAIGKSRNGGTLSDRLVSLIESRLERPEYAPLLPWLAQSVELKLAKAAVSRMFADSREDEALEAVKSMTVRPDDFLAWLPKKYWWELEWIQEAGSVSFDEYVSGNRIEWSDSLVRALAYWLKECPSKQIVSDRQRRRGVRSISPDKYLTHDQRERLCDGLPRRVLLDRRVLPFAVPRSVVRAAFDDLHDAELWERSPVAVRVVWLHRAFWEDGSVRHGHPSLSAGQHPLVIATVALYSRMGRSSPDAQAIVDKFDKELRACLMNMATDPAVLPIDLRPVLPDCMLALGRFSPNIPHCEARRRNVTEANSRGDDWCPRIRDFCIKLTDVPMEEVGHTDDPQGGRTKDVPGLPWRWASLAEVFRRVHAEPKPNGLRTGESYVTAISGYANRLHDIRERLVCGDNRDRKGCGARLDANHKYALREKSRYNATCFTCPNGHYPDPGRYFNHCWCCHRVIDSDESPFRELDGNGEAGPFLCWWCGAGREPADHGLCRIGERCPNCGDRSRMKKREKGFEKKSTRIDSTQLKCDACGHEINVPHGQIVHHLEYKKNYRAPFWWVN